MCFRHSVFFRFFYVQKRNFCVQKAGTSITITITKFQELIQIIKALLEVFLISNKTYIYSNFIVIAQIYKLILNSKMDGYLLKNLSKHYIKRL